MNTSGDRLKALLHECGLTPSDFAAQRRVTPQHVNNWFKRGIPLARLDELADLFCVHRRWLRSGEGPKHPSSILRHFAVQPTPNDSPTSLSTPATQLLQVPYHEVRHGQLVALDDHCLQLPAKALQALGIAPANAVCVAMPTRNMAPWMPRDAVLAIDLSQTQVIDGETYALLHNGTLRVNCLSLGHNDTLCLHNHDRHSYTVERFTAAQRQAQRLQILGWVFHWSHFRQQRLD
ncbi:MULTISPECIES: helix-turn-helix transcriptional regulator [unclassified Pseudomonas]|uniref:LexA family transcriptional regulator n=1 Tax=unclassified Pseudomonas TaxID=196821 RepID=UPI0038075EE4